jgi:hypothetical protein
MRPNERTTFKVFLAFRYGKREAERVQVSAKLKSIERSAIASEMGG